MSTALGPVIIQALEGGRSQFNGCYGAIIGSQGELLLVALDNGEVHGADFVLDIKQCFSMSVSRPYYPSIQLIAKDLTIQACGLD